MLAHELRNPLAPIVNSLEAIRLDRSDPAATVEALDIAARQVGHMARLLDDLLDVSRFTRGNVQLRKVPVDLTSVLRQAVETSSPLIEAGGHEFSVSLPAHPVWLEGDPTRLAQVVANLLNNAAKYTDRGGRIVLRPTAREMRRWSGCGTTASASPPRCSRASSTCSPRRTARSTVPRGAWGSG